MIAEAMSARDEPHAVVSIQAPVADGSTKEWTDAVALDAPLSIVVRRWADREGVPHSVVGCELITTGTWLDLSKTPAELGWKHGDAFDIAAYPLDPFFAEAGVVWVSEEEAEEPAAKAARKAKEERLAEEAPPEEAAEAARKAEEDRLE